MLSLIDKHRQEVEGLVILDGTNNYLNCLQGEDCLISTLR